MSLRTIQGVEQGETVSRGHTIQALAAALNTPLDALLTLPALVTEPIAVPSPARPNLPSAVSVLPTRPSLLPNSQLLQLLGCSAMLPSLARHPSCR